MRARLRQLATAALVLAACPAPAVDVGLSAAPDVPGDEVLRFVAVGDTGKGNDVQRLVAGGMTKACEARGGCRFALLLGDNIYQDGATASDDPQLATKFEEPYALVPFPFQVALGNHDYGANGAGWEFWKAAYEVDWSRRSPKWRLPARHYAFSDAHADFFALDTNALFWGFEADQRAAFEARRAASTRPWRIAFGHHPYRSNGRHGDAGAYDRVPGALPGSGSRWRDFFEDELCGKVDAYFAGHDHSLQDLGDVCGVNLVISGSGSSPTSVVRADRALFATSTPGFVLVEATARELVLHFVDANATVLYTRVIRR